MLERELNFHLHYRRLCDAPVDGGSYGWGLCHGCRGFFWDLSGVYHPSIGRKIVMEDFWVGIVALGLIIYLFAALLRPDKF